MSPRLLSTVSDGDVEWATRLKLLRKWDSTLCHAIDLRGGGGEKITIQFVMDQMLYPQARYFTPNGTCKKSICWNGLWNMSAVAEGSLAVRELAVWLWGSCVVSRSPWAETERDAAMALWQQGCGSRRRRRLPESPRGEEGKKTRRYRNTEPILLNVSVVERSQNQLFWMSQKVSYAYRRNICFVGWK